METVVVIDGDTVLYGSFAYREYKPRADGSLPTYTEEQDTNYLLNGLARFKKLISRIEEATYADRTVLVVKGEGNFRVDLFPEYKAHRKGAYRPVNDFVNALRKFSIDCLGAIPAHNMEADDLARIMFNEEAAKGNTPIIAHIDKDFMCIPGLHFRFANVFRPATLKKPAGRTVMFYGPDVSVINVTEEEATRFYYTQLLTGDSTDGIGGLPRVAIQRATAILEDCTTEAEMQKMVKFAYQTLMGDKWEEHLILTGQLITILPSRDFKFSIEDWA